MSLICVSLLKKKVSLKSEPPITSALLQVVLLSPPESFLVLFGGGEWIFSFAFALVFGCRERRWRRQRWRRQRCLFAEDDGVVGYTWLG